MNTSAPGPCTPAGKAIAARNATTHGLFARDIVLPALGEDPAAFDALLAQLIQQLPPRNLLERHYLEQIAAASWRLRRLHRWQAQVYEDATLTEDQRLDKLDKVLRHENALTRQIDRAVRTLNRDLKWLFESRARQEALYQRDLTEADIREVPDLGIEVQREVWRRLRPMPDPSPLDGCRLDNTPEEAAEPETTQKCQNEPAPSQPSHAGHPPACVKQNQDKNCQNEPPAKTAMTPESWPLSLSAGGGVPDEGGEGANRAGRGPKTLHLA